MSLLANSHRYLGLTCVVLIQVEVVSVSYFDNKETNGNQIRRKQRNGKSLLGHYGEK